MAPHKLPAPISGGRDEPCLYICRYPPLRPNIVIQPSQSDNFLGSECGSERLTTAAPKMWRLERSCRKATARSRLTSHAIQRRSAHREAAIHRAVPATQLANDSVVTAWPNSPASAPTLDAGRLCDHSATSAVSPDSPRSWSAWMRNRLRPSLDGGRYGFTAFGAWRPSDNPYSDALPPTSSTWPSTTI
jgi:hypothetical protein